MWKQAHLLTVTSFYTFSLGTAKVTSHKEAGIPNQPELILRCVSLITRIAFLNHLQQIYVSYISSLISYLLFTVQDRKSIKQHSLYLLLLSLLVNTGLSFLPQQGLRASNS